MGSKAKPSGNEISSSRSSEAVIVQIRKVEQNVRLYRKVDWNILPLLFLCYFLSFLDKVVLNYANIMGLTKSLHMDTNQFAWLATAFFIAYGVAEFPQG